MRGERHATIAEEDEVARARGRSRARRGATHTAPRCRCWPARSRLSAQLDEHEFSLMDDIGGADLIVDGTVFVSDDDERAFENEDDDAAEVVVNDGGGDWQVQLQTLMCWVLLCTLLVLVLLIFLSWRKYGRIIMRSRAGASADAKKKER